MCRESKWERGRVLNKCEGNYFVCNCDLLPGGAAAAEERARQRYKKSRRGSRRVEAMAGWDEAAEGEEWTSSWGGHSLTPLRRSISSIQGKGSVGKPSVVNPDTCQEVPIISCSIIHSHRPPPSVHFALSQHFVLGTVSVYHFAPLPCFLCCKWR